MTMKQGMYAMVEVAGMFMFGAQAAQADVTVKYQPIKTISKRIETRYSELDMVDVWHWRFIYAYGRMDCFVGCCSAWACRAC